MNDGLLVAMARKRLWVSVADVVDGEVTFDIVGLDELLDYNCQALVRQSPPSGIPFAVSESTEAASSVCDTLMDKMRKHAAANGWRRPRNIEEKFARLWRKSLMKQARQLADATAE